MIKTLLAGVLFAGLCVAECEAQPSSTTNRAVAWGKPVMGARLWVSLSTNVLTAGSTATLALRIENTSSDVIRVTETVTSWDFEVRLVSASGVSRRISAEGTNIFMGMGTDVELKPGEWIDWTDPVRVGKGVEPGPYTVTASRTITSPDNSEHKLTSNPLSVRVEPSSMTDRGLTWGKPVVGARLSATLSTNVLTAGSTATLMLQIENASTNSIYVTETGILWDFEVRLVSASGVSRKISAEPPMTFMAAGIEIEPGEGRDWKVPVGVGKDVDPGPYAMTVSRTITSPDNSDHKLTSNPIPVRIEK